MTTKRDLSEFDLSSMDGGGIQIEHDPCRHWEYSTISTVADAVAWAEAHDCDNLPPQPEQKPVDPTFRALWGSTIRTHTTLPPAFRRAAPGEAGETVRIRRKA